MNETASRGNQQVLLEQALELIPSRGVLEAAATPILGRLHVWPSGWQDETIYKRGFVVVERLVWTTNGDTCWLNGLRLLLLPSRQLELQRLAGSRTAATGLEWTATASPTTTAEILELWTLNEVLAGADGILRRALGPPARLLRALRATRGELGRIRDR